ncbi:ATP-binding cassette domain-containing protein [Maribius pontilimi]|uniref:ATP-binding cassette domain-containing protein n=1 Tax=Palleronia pontilimi TaxID=1964209 RepID=A0A934IHS9_9RHOB|nr:ATP-binding cassette domain-containing protein [Palleronia pontilimi]MBJ3763168.1 ATP-binding cassette domain-containing protein [Palleronia pontilimi]
MADGLHLDDITIGKDDETLIAIDARVAPGQVLSIMGPSGVGKSTLLAFLTGTLPPAFDATGHVRLDGRDLTGLPPEKRNLGILFQDDLLFPHLSVAGNLGFGLRGGSRAGRHAQVAAALDEVGLAGFGPRDPATLSGGQRARIALMRMLLARPDALLLDEAFSRLDSARRQATRRMVFDTARARGLPVVMVTHDPADAEAAQGPVIRLGDADPLRSNPT